MKQKISHTFDLVEERTKPNGDKIQFYEGIGYKLVLRQYSETGIDIHVTPDKEASKYIPYIYFHTDDEGRPVSVSTQTVSYGSLSINEYAELQRAMVLAQVAAEEIEARFIPHREDDSPTE